MSSSFPRFLTFLTLSLLLLVTASEASSLTPFLRSLDRASSQQVSAHGAYLGDYSFSSPFVVPGTGSSFIAPVVSEWILAYRFARPRVALTYLATGSGAGLCTQITNGSSACAANLPPSLSASFPFAGSDVPPTAAQSAAALSAGRPLAIFPWVAGPITPIFTLLPSGTCNFSGALSLDSPALARIFLGEISSWSDPAIAALNPSVDWPCVALRVPAITRVLRSDSSGTTEVFSGALRANYPAWPNATAVSTKWHASVLASCGASSPCKQVSGTFALVGTVLSTPGSVGYAAYSYALEAPAQVVRWLSPSGAPYGDPTNATRSAILGSSLDASNYADLVAQAVGREGAYPAATYSYLVVNARYDDASLPRCRALAEVRKFVEFVLSDPRALQATEIRGFVPPSEDVVAVIQQQLMNITCNGERLVENFLIPVPAWLPATVLALAAVGVVVSLALGAVLYFFRSNPHFVYGDIDFLALIDFGSLVIFVGLILYFAFPDGSAQPGLCMGAAWLIVLGLAVMYLSLILKVVRVYYTVVRADKLQKSKYALTFPVMASFLVCCLVPCIIVLAVWTGVDPVTTTHTGLNQYDEYYVVCKQHDYWWPLGFVIAGGVMLVFGAYIATSTRSLASGFNESGPLALAIYNALVIGGLVVLLMFVVGDVLVINIIFGIGIWVIALVPLLLIFSPKLYFAIKGAAVNISKAADARCARCFVECSHCRSKSSSKKSSQTKTVAMARTSMGSMIGDEA